MKDICGTVQGKITPTRDGGYIASAKHKPSGKSIKGVKRSTLQMAQLDRVELRNSWAEAIIAAAGSDSQ